MNSDGFLKKKACSYHQVELKTKMILFTCIKSLLNISQTHRKKSKKKTKGLTEEKHEKL